MISQSEDVCSVFNSLEIAAKAPTVQRVPTGYMSCGCQAECTEIQFIQKKHRLV